MISWWLFWRRSLHCFVNDGARFPAIRKLEHGPCAGCAVVSYKEALLGCTSDAPSNDEAGLLIHTNSCKGGMGEASVIFCTDDICQKGRMAEGEKAILAIVEKRNPSWSV